jgi:hypothetical protein
MPSGGAPIAEPSAPGPVAGAEPEESLRSLLLKALGAVGTGIGVLGFVTFFGGAIVWLRAEEAGLPPNEAVAAVPRSDLITIGASYLVPALLIALAAVGLLAVLHVTMASRAWLRSRGRWEQAQNLGYEAEKAIRGAQPEENVATTAREVATNRSQILERAEAQGVEGDRLAALRAEADEAQKTAVEREESARLARASAEAANKAAEEAKADVEFLRKRPPSWTKRLTEYGATGAALVAVPIFLDGPHVPELGWLDTAILLAFALGAAVISLTAYMVTERFLWFGVAAFVGIALYTACATYFRTTNARKVQPVAALRADRDPAVGMYIASTSEDVYIGTFSRPGDPPHLLIVPQSQVADVTVGPLLGPTEARSEALRLAIHECEGREEAQPKTKTKPAPAKKACTPREMTYLRKTLAQLVRVHPVAAAAP